MIGTATLAHVITTLILSSWDDVEDIHDRVAPTVSSLITEDKDSLEQQANAKDVTVEEKSLIESEAPVSLEQPLIYLQEQAAPILQEVVENGTKENIVKPIDEKNAELNPTSHIQLHLSTLRNFHNEILPPVEYGVNLFVCGSTPLTKSETLPDTLPGKLSSTVLKLANSPGRVINLDAGDNFVIIQTGKQ
jgi:hypothetical protein